MTPSWSKNGLLSAASFVFRNHRAEFATLYLLLCAYNKLSFLSAKVKSLVEEIFAFFVCFTTLHFKKRFTQDVNDNMKYIPFFPLNFPHNLAYLGMDVSIDGRRTLIHFFISETSRDIKKMF